VSIAKVGSFLTLGCECVHTWNPLKHIHKPLSIVPCSIGIPWQRYFLPEPSSIEGPFITPQTCDSAQYSHQLLARNYYPISTFQQENILKVGHDFQRWCVLQLICEWAIKASHFHLLQSYTSISLDIHGTQVRTSRRLFLWTILAVQITWMTQKPVGHVIEEGKGLRESRWSLHPAPNQHGGSGGSESRGTSIFPGREDVSWPSFPAL